MIKIEETGFLFPSDYKKTKNTGKKSSVPFWMKLDNVIEESEIDSFIQEKSELSLEDSLSEINKQGERLKSRISNENLNNYRKAIKSFFKIVCANAFETKEEFSSGVVFQKKYTTIRIIDEKLNKLAISILQKQMSQLDILNRLEEIQGLLINLLQ